MAGKLSILFKILITLSIGFKSESQFFEEDPNEKEFKQKIKDWEPNLPEQYDTNYNFPDPIMDSNELEQSPFDSKMPEQFDINKVKHLQEISDSLSKSNEEISKIDIKPLDFTPPGTVRFKASDIPYVILFIIAASAVTLVCTVFRSSIVLCMEKRRLTQSPTRRRLIWLTFRRTDSDARESSGDGSGPQESKGEKTHLINV